MNALILTALLAATSAEEPTLVQGPKDWDTYFVVEVIWRECGYDDYYEPQYGSGYVPAKLKEEEECQ